MTEQSINSVLFDLDGTLMDTAVDMIHALMQLADNHQIEHQLNVADYRQYISKGAVALVNAVFDDPAPNRLEALRQEYLEIYQQQLNTHSQLFDGIADLLQHLNQNNIPWGIVTNKPSWLAKPIVHNTAELEASRILVCADQVGIAKPDPKPLLHAAQQMQIIPQQTLYLGDAKSDVDAAHAAQMRSAVALWGYLAPEDDVSQWLAHHQFQWPHQLKTETSQ